MALDLLATGSYVIQRRMFRVKPDLLQIECGEWVFIVGLQPIEFPQPHGLKRFPEFVCQSCTCSTAHD